MINFNNYSNFAQSAKISDRVLFRLWAENTAFPELNKLASQTLQQLNSEIQAVEEEWEQWRQAGSTTIYCGYGTSVDSLRQSLSETEELILDIEKYLD